MNFAKSLNPMDANKVEKLLSLLPQIPGQRLQSNKVNLSSLLDVMLQHLEEKEGDITIPEPKPLTALLSQQIGLKPDTTDPTVLAAHYLTSDATQQNEILSKALLNSNHEVAALKASNRSHKQEITFLKSCRKPTRKI